MDPRKIHVVRVAKEGDDLLPKAKWDAQQELGADQRMALAFQTLRPEACLGPPFVKCDMELGGGTHSVTQPLTGESRSSALKASLGSWR